MNPGKPLVVDLDRSLVRSDTLHEAVAGSLREPRVLFGALLALVKGGKAAFKTRLAEATDIHPETLPLNTSVLGLLGEVQAQGRPVVIATGADERYAEAIAARIPGGVAAVHSSNGKVNLTSSAKASLLVELYGERGFDYVGDSRKDLRVWERADKAYLVAQGGVPRWAAGVNFVNVLREKRRSPLRAWVKELRLHQTLKGLVACIPAAAAHDFRLSTWLTLAATFVTFAAMSSSVYLLNDLVDLRADRVHPSKRRRPLAAGEVSPVAAAAVSALLGPLALVCSYLLDPGFFLVLVTYAVTTVAYSFWIKRLVLVDVAVLALLYMIRIVAGAVVTETSMSFSLTSVALFFFISLALVKRYTELTRHAPEVSKSGLPGRGYTGADAQVILPLGVGAAMAVQLLLASYLQSQAVTTMYPSRQLLWLVIPLAFYWMGNIWIKAGRGLVHDDPILFAVKDRASVLAGAAIIGVFVLATSDLASWAGEFAAWWG